MVISPTAWIFLCSYFSLKKKELIFSSFQILSPFYKNNPFKVDLASWQILTPSTDSILFYL